MDEFLRSQNSVTNGSGKLWPKRTAVALPLLSWNTFRRHLLHFLYLGNEGSNAILLEWTEKFSDLNFMAVAIRSGGEDAE